jgi:DDE superfamily endonuclease
VLPDRGCPGYCAGAAPVSGGGADLPDRGYYGSAHHPSTAPARIRPQFPQVEVVHLPVYSSWLNQIELYFSIVQRKTLTPADFDSVAALEQRLRWFQWYYNQQATPFRSNYTRTDLERYLERLATKQEV